jgi:hypothetical protein
MTVERHISPSFLCVFQHPASHRPYEVLRSPAVLESAVSRPTVLDQSTPPSTYFPWPPTPFVSRQAEQADEGHAARHTQQQQPEKASFNLTHQRLTPPSDRRRTLIAAHAPSWAHAVSCHVFHPHPHPVPIRPAVVTRRDSRGGPAPFFSRNKAVLVHSRQIDQVQESGHTKEKRTPTKLSGWVPSFTRWGNMDNAPWKRLERREAQRLPFPSPVFPTPRGPDRPVRPTTWNPKQPDS